MSLRVRDGIGIGTPGRFTPLCEVTRRRRSRTAQRARPASTSSTRRRTSPSSISTSCPGWSTSLITAGLIGSSPLLQNSAADDDDLLAADERDRCVEVADPQLRSLQVGDQGDRPPELRLGGADEPRPLAVFVMRAVRKVEPRPVDAGGGQRGEHVAVGRGGADRGDDLRSTRCFGHPLRVARPSPVARR